jgi:hypothetical protein
VASGPTITLTNGTEIPQLDVDLDESAMAAISALNRDERTRPNPDEFNYIPG